MIPPAGSVHEHGARGRAEVCGPQRAGCILRDRIDAGHAKRRRLVASEHPCCTVDVEDNRMTTGTRGVNADGLYIAERPEDVRFEKVRMAGKWGG